MADLPGYLETCFQTGKLVTLGILVSGGIVLQFLACALYNNWWLMLSVIMYVLLPMPLLFLDSSDGSSMVSESGNSWVEAAKFIAGASIVGSIALPCILKHGGIISWGAFILDVSSLFVFVVTILCFIWMNTEDDDYSMF